MNTAMDIAIIGAGLAGVAAAKRLSASGHRVVVFEKSRGLGGRCATKRWEGSVVDHGAQYFTLRDSTFRAAVHAACGDSVIEIAALIVDQGSAVITGSSRWYHRDGNSRLARDLGAGLEIRTNTPIDDAIALLRRNGGGFDHVISTAPFPQTARLFGIEATDAYVPCVTGVFAYEGEWLGLTRERYAVRNRTDPLAWTACENHKTGRIASGHTVLVAQMSESFSREHLDRSPAEYVELVRPFVEACWQVPPSKLVGAFGHRWRYARVRQALIPPELPPGLHFVGDAITESRVEAAWLAGNNLSGQDRMSLM